MKYKDYYSILNVERTATAAEIKKSYQKLARKYHPDVSKDPKGEEKFKDAAEAYQTLKDPEKRVAYDRLGSYQAGQEFQPSQDWGNAFNTQFNNGAASAEGIDLSDLFASFARHRNGGGTGGSSAGGGQSRPSFPLAGEDFEVAAQISLEEVYTGTTVALNLSMPIYDAQNIMHREPRTFNVNVPKGASLGQRLRLRGKGGKGRNGGPDGDLYLTISFYPHPLYRVSGHDLYVDVPIAPWEAALGATVDIPTLGGAVSLKIAPCTNSGQQLRLAKRGLPKADGSDGNLLAIIKIVMPPTLTEQENTLFTQLAAGSTFTPRQQFTAERKNADQ